MKTILKAKRSTYGNPYAYYTFLVSQKKRTPDTVTLKVRCKANLRYSTSYLLTGDGKGLVAGIKIGGKWYEWRLKSESASWRGRKKHWRTTTITVPASVAQTALTAKVRVRRSAENNYAASLKATSCSKSITITSVASKYKNVKLTGSASSQAKAKATISGLPAAVGYTRVICWYRGGTLVGTTVVKDTNKSKSFSKTFNNLDPSTTYKIKAVVHYKSKNGTILATKSVSITTPAETGKLTITPKSTYIKVNVANMFLSPNYTRKVQIYYKKSSAAKYKLYKTINTQKKDATANIKNLNSSTKYNVKVLIKDGNKVLKTLTGTTTTLAAPVIVKPVEPDEPETPILPEIPRFIPSPEIDSVEHSPGDKYCTVNWFVDVAVAYIQYQIQVKVPSGSWTTVATVNGLKSPTKVSVSEKGVDVQFRIRATHRKLTDMNPVYSNVVTAHVWGPFSWDVKKSAGEAIVITANEWNRLRDYVMAMNPNAVIKDVRTGDEITADIYNTMKNAVNMINSTNVANKKRGDAITAADVDALRVAINKSIT